MGSIIQRHPFVDGNRRTATASASYLLTTFGLEVEAEQRELEDFAVIIAKGNLDIVEIGRWFENHSYRSPEPE